MAVLPDHQAFAQQNTNSMTIRGEGASAVNTSEPCMKYAGEFSITQPLACVNASESACGNPEAKEEQSLWKKD